MLIYGKLKNIALKSHRGIYLPLYAYLVQYGYYVKIQYFNLIFYIC